MNKILPLLCRMTDPKDLQIKHFTYDLPENRIAKFPLQQRDASKLLLYKNGDISGDIFYNIHHHIPADSLLIFNNTRVIEARLLFALASGTVVEIFCLEPFAAFTDIAVAMLQKEKTVWKCLVGNAKKWKTETLTKKIDAGDASFELTAKKMEKKDDYFIIEFSWGSDLSFAEVLHATGVIPLPPYLKRAAEKSDSERYQTIYANKDGSVAAPTAGLHFTNNVFENLTAKNIYRDFVTLHVGAGTFMPVKSETMKAHNMHTEFIEVQKELVENILKQKEKIIAVGTTSLRTIESIYWMGVKTLQQKNLQRDEMNIAQWESYEIKKDIPVADALESLLAWMRQQRLEKLFAKTQIMIAPGYEVKIADALVTNFHQPQSTLLLLVAAITGTDWRKIYDYALQNDFRFLSYGDSSLLWRT